MTGFAVFGMLMLAIVLWVFIPRATTAVLMMGVLVHQYPWLGPGSHPGSPHASIVVFTVVAVFVGVIAGLVLDYLEHRLALKK